MTDTLSEALHARLDRMGAPPRETPAVEPQPGESQAPASLEVIQGGQAEATSELGESPQGDELDGNAEASQGDEQQQAPGETPERYKAAEFAEAIGWEPKDLYESLEIPIGEAGETLTLGEIKDQFGVLAAQRAEVEQAQQALQAEHAQLQEQAQRGALGQQELTEELRNAMGKMAGIEYQYAQVDWEKIEAENPGQAANLRQKFATAYAGAKSELQTARQQQQQQAQAAAQQFVAQQQAKVVELVPEWRDEKVFQEENAGISEYMLHRGFTPEELPTIYHAGMRAMARDAWMWHQHQAEVGKAAGKMHRPAPKPVLRPGGPSKPTLADRQIGELEQRALQTGRREDQLAALRATVQSSMRKR